MSGAPTTRRPAEPGARPAHTSLAPRAPGAARPPRRRAAIAAALALVAAAAPGPGRGEARERCQDAPLRSKGTVHYYCDCQAGAAPGCVPGDDANAGTRAKAPRRTLAAAAARAGSLGAGDTIAFCRTGAWSEGGLRLGGACRASAPCDLRDYVPPWGDASSPRPVFALRAGVNFADLLGPGTLEGLRFWNLDVRHAVPNESATLLVYGPAPGSIRHLDVCNVSSRGASLALNLGAGAGPGIVVRDSQFYDTGFSAILGGADGLVIDGNTFENNGLRQSPQEHTVYLANSARGIRFTNNDVVTDGRCAGVMVVAHSVLPDLVIENNRITTTSTNPNCYGIQTAGSSAPWSQFDRAAIRRNRVTTRGSTGIEASSCIDCTISANLVIGGEIAIGKSRGSSSASETERAVVQNNTVRGGHIRVRSGGGHALENNAVWTDEPACFLVDAPGVRHGGNYCRASGGIPLERVFVDARAGDYRPVSPGPLAGTASQTRYAPTAIGSIPWSPADPGVVRAPPIDIGAYQR